MKYEIYLDDKLVKEGDMFRQPELIEYLRNANAHIQDITYRNSTVIVFRIFPINKE